MQSACFIQRFICDERGTTAIEYALISALLVVAIVSSITAIGAKAKLLYGTVSTATAAVVSAASAATAANVVTTGNGNNGNWNGNGNNGNGNNGNGNGNGNNGKFP